MSTPPVVVEDVEGEPMGEITLLLIDECDDGCEGVPMNDL